ncbi:hypothetical protein T492DRAFT_1010653, partial [Pavlovales sp. CCMP2436]
NLRFGLERYAAQLQSLCCHGDFADSYDWLATSSICHLQVFDPLLAKFAPALARARHLQAVDLYDDSNSEESVTENTALLEVWLRSDYAKAGLRSHTSRSPTAATLRLEGGAFAEGFPSCLRGLQLRKLSFSEYFVDPKKGVNSPRLARFHAFDGARHVQLEHAAHVAARPRRVPWATLHRPLDHEHLSTLRRWDRP